MFILNLFSPINTQTDDKSESDVKEISKINQEVMDLFENAFSKQGKKINTTDLFSWNNIKQGWSVIWNRGDLMKGLGVPESDVEGEIKKVKDEIRKNSGNRNHLVAIYDLIREGMFDSLEKSIRESAIGSVLEPKSLRPIIEVNLLNALNSLVIKADCIKSDCSPIESIISKFSESFGNIDYKLLDEKRHQISQIFSERRDLGEDPSKEDLEKIKEKLSKPVEEFAKANLAVDNLMKLLFPKGQSSLYLPNIKDDKVKEMLWTTMRSFIPVLHEKLMLLRKETEPDQVQVKKYEDLIKQKLGLNDSSFLKSIAGDIFFNLLASNGSKVRQGVANLISKDSDLEKKTVEKSQNAATFSLVLTEIMLSKNPDVQALISPFINLLNNNALIILTKLIQVVESKGKINDKLVQELVCDLQIPEDLLKLLFSTEESNKLYDNDGKFDVKSAKSMLAERVKVYVEDLASIIKELISIQETSESKLKDVGHQDSKNQISTLCSTFINNFENKVKLMGASRSEEAEKYCQRLTDMMQTLIPGFNDTNSRAILGWVSADIANQNGSGFTKSLIGVFKGIVLNSFLNSYNNRTDRDDSFLSNLLNKFAEISSQPFDSQQASEWQELVKIRRTINDLSRKISDCDVIIHKTELNQKEKEAIIAYDTYENARQQYADDLNKLNKIKQDLNEVVRSEADSNELKNQHKAQEVLVGESKKYQDQKEIEYNSLYKDLSYFSPVSKVVQAKKERLNYLIQVNDWEANLRNKTNHLKPFIESLKKVIGLDSFKDIIPVKITEYTSKANVNVDALMQDLVHDTIFGAILDHDAVFNLLRQRNSYFEKLKTVMQGSDLFTPILKNVAKSISSSLGEDWATKEIGDLLQVHLPELKEVIIKAQVDLAKSDKENCLNVVIETLLAKILLEQIDEKGESSYLQIVRKFLKVTYKMAIEGENPQAPLLDFLGIHSANDLEKFGVPKSIQELAFTNLGNSLKGFLKDYQKQNEFLFDIEGKKKQFFESIDKNFQQHYCPKMKKISEELKSISTSIDLEQKDFIQYQSLTEMQSEIDKLKTQIKSIKSKINAEIDRIGENSQSLWKRIAGIAAAIFCCRRASIDGKVYKKEDLEISLSKVIDTEKRLSHIQSAFEGRKDSQFGKHACDFIKNIAVGVVEFSGQHFAETENGAKLMIKSLRDLLSDQPANDGSNKINPASPLAKSIIAWLDADDKANEKKLMEDFDVLFKEFAPTTKRDASNIAIRNQMAVWLERILFEPVTNGIHTALKLQGRELEEVLMSKLFKVISDHFKVVHSCYEKTTEGKLSISALQYKKKIQEFSKLGSSSGKSWKTILDVDGKVKNVSEEVSKGDGELPKQTQSSGLKDFTLKYYDEDNSPMEGWSKNIIQKLFPNNEKDIKLSDGNKQLYDLMQSELIPMVIDIIKPLLSFQNLSSIVTTLLEITAKSLEDPFEEAMRENYDSRSPESQQLDECLKEVIEGVWNIWSSDALAVLSKIPGSKDYISNSIVGILSEIIKSKIDGRFVETHLDSLVFDFTQDVLQAERSPLTAEQRKELEEKEKEVIKAKLAAANKKATEGIFYYTVYSRLKPIVKLWNQILDAVSMPQVIREVLGFLFRNTLLALFNLIISLALYLPTKAANDNIVMNATDRLVVFTNDIINKSVVMNMLRVIGETIVEAENSSAVV